MANAGSILLQMAAELKLSSVLQDFDAANADVDATNAVLQQRSVAIRPAALQRHRIATPCPRHALSDKHVILLLLARYLLEDARVPTRSSRR